MIQKRTPNSRLAFQRLLFAAILQVLVSCTTGSPAPNRAELAIRQEAFASEAYPVRLVDRREFAARFWPAEVPAPAMYAPGTIVIDAALKLLYLVRTDGKARRYGIAVGASGHAWSGTATIGRWVEWPAWYPTDDMHAQAPQLPRRIEPGPHNPLGARALYLYQNGVDTLYRIHGTSEPWTIGTAASSGMHSPAQRGLIDLYDRVDIGARVVVL